MTKRWTAFLLCVMIFLTGCRKPENGYDSENTPSNTEHITVDGALEHVWTGTEYELPEGWTTSGPIAYDPETATIFAEAYRHTESNGTEYALCTLTEKAYQLEPFRSMEDEDTRVMLSNTLRTDDALWYVKTLNPGTAQSKRYLVRRDLETGEETDAALSSLFDGGDAFFYGFLADKDGDIWLSTLTEVMAIRPDFSRILSVRFERGGDLLMRADGTVFVLTENPSGPILAGIDKTTGGRTEEIPLPPSRHAVCFPAETDSPYAYLYAASGGVFGARINEKGEIVSECLLDYVNSSMNADTVELIGPAGTDGLLFLEDGHPVVCRPAGTVNLADVTMLTVAISRPLWDQVVQDAIADFNRTHTDARIMLLDYSTYATAENATAGSERLALDMAAGICFPDIIVGRPGEDASIDLILDKERYVDLYPFLDADPELSRESILDCVLTAFDDRGRLWCLSNYFLFDTLLVHPDVLEACGLGGKTSWTLAEFLDFAETLPEGVELTGGLLQDDAIRVLLGNYGLGAFFDREEGICSFDSSEFIRWLRFTASLPKDEAELRKRSPVYAASEPERYDFMMNGKVALASSGAAFYMALPYLETAFGRKDWVMIGYPGAGTEVSAQTVYAITSTCTVPALAWEFVRTAVLEERESYYGRDVFPILKDRFRDGLAQLYDQEIIQYFSGNMHITTPKPDPPTTYADLREPGYIVDFTEADAEHILDSLASAGVPLSKRIPDEVTSILNEELSAFLAGHGTAEDCAAKIQSRVSLWLAERN